MPLWKTGNALAGEPGSLYHGDECCCGACCHFINCDESAETSDLYLDCTDIIASLLPGDVVEIDDECWEYQGEVECDDDPPGDYGDIYATCDDCLCLCAIYVDCCDDENEVRFKRCRPFTEIIGPGDVIKFDGKCYTYDHGVDCQGGEDEINEGNLVDDCLACKTCYLLTNCDDPGDTTTIAMCDEALQDGDVILWGGDCYTVEKVDCAGSPPDVDPADAEQFESCESCTCGICNTDIHQCDFQLDSPMGDGCQYIGCDVGECFDEMYDVWNEANSIPMGFGVPILGCGGPCLWGGDTGWVEKSNPYCPCAFDDDPCHEALDKRATAEVCVQRFTGFVRVTSRVQVQTRLRKISGIAGCPNYTDGAITYQRVNDVPVSSPTERIDCRAAASGDHDYFNGGFPTCGGGGGLDPINVTYS